MEFRHIKYFLTLSEELHFRRAAEKLFIAQPALSRQIKELEAQLGVTLFKRDKRNVSLTPAGKFLQNEGYQIVKRMDFIESSISTMGKELSGKINIGCIGSAMVSVIPELIHKIGVDFPAIRTSLTEDTTQNLLNALVDGQIDIMFGRQVTNSNIQSKLIHTESTVLAIAKNSKWSIGKNSSVSDLSAVPFILFPRHAGASFRNQIIQACSKNGFYPEIKHESIHAQSILRLVEKDLGISIIPQSLASGYNLSIEYLKLKEMDISLDLMMSYKKENRDEIIDKVLALI